MPVQLVAKNGFSAFGKDYPAGTVIPQDDVKAWPPNTLAIRMNNGWVEYADVQDGEETVGGPTDYEQIQRESNAKAAADEASDISKMSEVDLKAFVELHNVPVDPDKSSSLSAKRKAVADAYAQQQAAVARGGVAGNQATPQPVPPAMAPNKPA